MLVVSCTVEDCDEMKNQLRKVYAIVAWGNYSHTSKQEVFFVLLVDALSVWESEI